MCHAHSKHATEIWPKHGWSNPNVFTVYINTVTPLLYTLGRLGLEESADHLMSLSIISATTKRSRSTVFASALFHGMFIQSSMYALFQTLYYPSTFPRVQWDSSSHTVQTSEVYQRRCIDCLFLFVCMFANYDCTNFLCQFIILSLWSVYWSFVGSIIMFV